MAHEEEEKNYNEREREREKETGTEKERGSDSGFVGAIKQNLREKIETHLDILNIEVSLEVNGLPQ